MVEIQDVLNNILTQNLCVYDSIHDFWKERKRKAKAAEDDEDDSIDQSSLQKTHEKLLSLINKKYRLDVKDVNKVLQSLSGNHIRSATSDYEYTVRDYYDNMPQLNTISEYLTYDDIIENKNSWDDYIGGATNFISLEPGEKYNSFSAVMANKKQNVIAEFIMKYMFPGSNANMYITFDAKSGILRNIFREIEQVYNLITPANIADSANTSFNQLQNGRNIFYFTRDKKHTFHSNFFTGNDISMEFINNGFSDKNNYGFTLHVKDNKSSLEFPFSAKQSSGPSVNYLVDLMLNRTSQTRNMVNIDKLKTKPEWINNGLLFDIKRGGDYEQVNMAKKISNELGNVIVSTIDILCSVYSRCIQQPVIRHINDKMEIYRFQNMINLDQELNQLFSMKYKSLKLIQSLSLVKSVLENGLANELYDFYIKAESFVEKGTFLFSHNLKKAKSSQNVVPSDEEKIITILLKHRFKDIVEMFQKVINDIEEIRNLLNQVNITDTEQDVFYLSEFVQLFGGDIQKEPLLKFVKTYNIESILSKYEVQSTTGTLTNQFTIINTLNKFMQKINVSFSLTNSQSKILNTGKSPFGLNIELTENIDGVYYYVYMAEIASIKLHGKKYLELCDSLSKLERVLDRPRHPSFHSILTDAGYFKQLNAIFQSYFNNDYGESVYNLLSPQKYEDNQIKSWYKSLLSNTNKLRISHNKLSKPQPIKKININKRTQMLSPIATNQINAPFQSPQRPTRKSRRIIKMRGGDRDVTVYQYMDLNDALADICFMCASYLESVMGEYMMRENKTKSKSKSMSNKTRSKSRTRSPGTRRTRSMASHVSNFVEYLIYNHQSQISDIMDKVSYTFEMKILSMYNQVDGLYEYVPSEVELYLLCVLYMNKNKNQENLSYMLSQNEDIFGEINKKRLEVPLNDIGTKYAFMANVPPEIANILVFTLLDNILQDNKTGYFNKFISDLVKQKQIVGRSFDTKHNWSKVIDIVYVLTHGVSNNKFVIPQEVRQLLF